MYARHQLGQESEVKAEKWYLDQPGYKLLAKNVRCRWGEIDLVFEYSSVTPSAPLVELVFVEVRARVTKVWVNGPQSVDWKKQRRLSRTAQYYLNQYSGPAKSVRMDLLYWDGKVWEHIPNIWLIE